jgi:serine/threonine protein kinase
MSDTKNLKKLQAAVELGYLSNEQVGAIEEERKNSNFPAIEVAIRKGYLNRQQLDVLEVFSNPLEVVPGYRVDGMLGAGGVGTVYKATQLGMDRPVAIKTINRAAARNDLTPKRFEREARIVGQLKHPNIIAAIDFGVHNEQLYLVMEFVDGIDAEKYLDQTKKVPELHGWYLALQVSHALESANQVGIIHRDIKPGNMILTQAPRGSALPRSVPFVKVGDFGLAKFTETQRDATITLDHSVSGTPYYMSPEQVQAVDIDHRSDIYSLGITVWHLIEGCPPVFGTSPLDVITNKMKLEDTWLSEKPEGISEAGFQLLQRMCRYDREQRIGNYGELSSEIESVIGSLKNTLGATHEFSSEAVDFSASTKLTTVNDLSATFADGDQQNSTDLTDSTDFQLDESAEHVQVTREIVPAVATQANQPTRKTKSNQSFMPTILAALAVAMLLLLSGYLLWKSTNAGDSPSTAVDPSTAQHKNGNLENEVARTQLGELAGPPIFLFNGDEMDPTQKSTGTWDVSTGGEGEPVLAGNGTRNFRCVDTDRKPLSSFRFECGFRHNEADEINFLVMDASGKVLLEVNISPTKIVLTSAGSDKTQSHALQQFDEKSFGYHRCRIESQPEHWRIEVDSTLVGEILKPAGSNSESEPATIQLAVEGMGNGHFEAIRFQQLK